MTFPKLLKSITRSAGLLSLVIFLSNVMFSCSEDNAPWTDITGSDDPILLKATLSEHIATRGYIEKGKVTTGLYYMIYPYTNNKDSLAYVDFDREGYEGTGRTIAATQLGPLTWSIVSGSKPILKLDNVAPEFNKFRKDSLTSVTFVPDIPFVAGRVTDEGENDILWASDTIAKNTSPINFKLHHVMSKFKVVITVDETNMEDEELDLTTAEVYVSNLVHRPYNYNRITGNIKLAPNPERLPLTVVNTVETADASDKIQWLDIDKPVGEKILTVYTTQDFILPPQTLSNDPAVRPQLVIKIHTKSGKVRTFQGYLPYAMDVYFDGEDKAPTPVSLAFIREQYLTIRTLISTEYPQLIFMPVEVVEWVHKGEYTVYGNQAGIYSEEDFNQLFVYYSSKNETMLERFGKRKSDGSWEFNIFGNLVLEYDDIWRKMVPGGNENLPEFSFYINPYFSITIMDDGIVKEVLQGDTAAQKLYDIVTGKD